MNEKNRIEKDCREIGTLNETEIDESDQWNPRITGDNIRDASKRRRSGKKNKVKKRRTQKWDLCINALWLMSGYWPLDL